MNCAVVSYYLSLTHRSMRPLADPNRTARERYQSYLNHKRAKIRIARRQIAIAAEGWKHWENMLTETRTWTAAQFPGIYWDGMKRMAMTRRECKIVSHYTRIPRPLSTPTGGPINEHLTLLGDIYMEYESLLFPRTRDLVSWMCVCKANRTNFRLRMIIKARKKIHQRTQERAIKRECYEIIFIASKKMTWASQRKKFNKRIAKHKATYRKLMKCILKYKQRMSHMFSKSRMDFLFENRKRLCSFHTHKATLRAYILDECIYQLRSVPVIQHQRDNMLATIHKSKKTARDEARLARAKAHRLKKENH